MLKTIQVLQEIRRDGKLIEEGMSGADMIRAGWSPDKIITLRWIFQGQSVELNSAFGFLCRVTKDRQFLAVLEDTDATGMQATLTVYRPDGQIHLVVANQIQIGGILQPGFFLSFRTPTSPHTSAFCVLFERRNTQVYQVDLNANTAEVLNCEAIHY